MKKWTLALLLLLFLIPAQAHAATIYEKNDQLPVTIHIDGYYQPCDVDPIIQNGRTLLPLRVAAEALNAQVDWRAATREVVIVSDGRTIIFRMDANQFTINGIAQPLDVPMAIIEGRTLVPLRAFAEALGAQVDWDGQIRDVRIISGKQTLASAVPDFGLPDIQWLFNKFYLHPERFDGVNGNWIYNDPDNDQWTEVVFIAPINEHTYQLVHLKHDGHPEMPATVVTRMNGGRDDMSLFFHNEDLIYYKAPPMGLQSAVRATFSLANDQLLTHVSSCLLKPGPNSECISEPVDHNFHRLML